MARQMTLGSGSVGRVIKAKQIGAAQNAPTLVAREVVHFGRIFAQPRAGCIRPNWVQMLY